MQIENCKLQIANLIEGEVDVTPDELSERLLNFAARVGKVVDALPETRLGRHIAGQLVVAATSPAPNYEEACAGESRADFVHKLQIAPKELRESRCWIRLIIASECCLKLGWPISWTKSNQLARIVAQSVVTTKAQKEPTTLIPDNATSSRSSICNLKFPICNLK